MIKAKLQDERTLLMKIAGGSQSAFRELFTRYHPFVYAFARKITRSDDLAMEVVQDVFLKIWLHREGLIKIENFKAYLNRIVRNHCFNVLRKLANESRAIAASWDDGQLEDHATIEKLEYNEVQQILEDALETLSPQQKKVYQLCHQEGLKYEEAALEMGISSQTVHAYMKDALRKIRDHFRKHAISYTLFFAALFSLYQS